MPVVNYSKDNALTLREPGVKYRFLPGANEVPQDVWDRLQNNESLKAFKARGILTVVMVKPPKQAFSRVQRIEAGGEGGEEKELSALEEADIGKMDAFSAIALVESVINLDHLRRFTEQENDRKGGGRKTVLSVLKTQIEAMDTEKVPEE